MKNLIKTIREKDRKITDFFENQELTKLEKILSELEEEHQEIKKQLKEVNYLLDLIEKHKISSEKGGENQQRKERGNWLEKIKKTIESIHLLPKQKLSKEDITFLQSEKSKLLFEKEQLEKEHHLIHHLIAKTEVFLMDAQNIVCKEITKGYDIAAVGEKLLEHFGKELKDTLDYEQGRNKIRKMLEETFSINKIASKKLIDLLEKSNVIYYQIDFSNIIEYPIDSSLDEFTSTNYVPLFGTWHINA